MAAAKTAAGGATAANKRTLNTGPHPDRAEAGQLDLAGRETEELEAVGVDAGGAETDPPTELGAAAMATDGGSLFAELGAAATTTDGT